MAPKVEKVVDGVTLGEGPHWDLPSQSLLFVDLMGKQLLKYTPATRNVAKVSTAPKQTSFIIPVEGKKDQFVISLNNDVVLISWDGVSDQFKILEKLETLDGTDQTPYNVVNDAKVDSSGRLWTGTLEMDPKIVEEGLDKIRPVGSLYSFTGKNDVKKHVSKIKVSNGLGWNDKINKFYYVDSMKGTIDQYDYDRVNGTISNVQALFTLNKHNGIEGVADGLSVDSDGNLWVAVFGSGKVLKIDGLKPETLLDSINIPAVQVTSTAWGGKNLDELYVTTGRIEQKGVKPDSPADGATYKITGTGAKGLPAHNFKL